MHFLCIGTAVLAASRTGLNLETAVGSAVHLFKARDKKDLSDPKDLIGLHRIGANRRCSFRPLNPLRPSAWGCPPGH